MTSSRGGGGSQNKSLRGEGRREKRHETCQNEIKEYERSASKNYAYRSGSGGPVGSTYNNTDACSERGFYLDIDKIKRGVKLKRYYYYQQYTIINV